MWIPIQAGRVYFFGNPARRFNEVSTIRLCHALLADAGAFVDIGAHVGGYISGHFYPSSEGTDSTLRNRAKQTADTEMAAEGASTCVRVLPHLTGRPFCVSLTSRLRALLDGRICDRLITAPDVPAASTIVTAAGEEGP